MERQLFPSNKSISAKPVVVHLRQPQPGQACQRCGQRLKAKRVVRRTVKYCGDCAAQVRREQSAQWKRDKRRELGSRSYREEYAPYTAEGQREKWREQKRKQRERQRRQKLPTELIQRWAA